MRLGSNKRPCFPIADSTPQNDSDALTGDGDLPIV